MKKKGLIKRKLAVNPTDEEIKNKLSTFQKSRDGKDLGGLIQAIKTKHPKFDSTTMNYIIELNPETEENDLKMIKNHYETDPQHFN